MNSPSPTHVLQVEDSPTDALLTREELERFPRFRLTQVERLDEALRVLSSDHYAVALLDLGLPDSQGMDTLVRFHREAPHVPVVVMTARTDEELALRALHAGAQDYIIKGQSTEFLLDRTIRYAIERNLAKQALHQSEELFRGAFEHTAVAMVLTDLGNRFVRVNESFARMFGYAPLEMAGMTMAEVTHPDDLAASLAERERLLAGDVAFFQVEKRYGHRDGHTFWGLTNVSLVRDSEHKAQLYVGQVHDITDQKRAESERDRLFRESMNLLGVVGFDGRLQRINPAWERALGHPTAELLAEPFMSFVHPEDREQARAEIVRVEAGGLVTSHENRLRCRDGTYRSFLWSGTPLVDQKCVSVSGHDITDRKRAESALKLSEFSVQNASLATLWIAPDARVIRANRATCELLGYTEAELLTRAIIDLDPDFPAERWPSHWRELRERKRMSFVTRQKHKNGHVIPVEVDLNWFEFEGREYNFAFVRDLTERNQLEEQLRQSQKMEAVGQLAGGVAHDFNNLLTIISGYSDIILSAVAANDPVREFVRNISVAGERAASLTRQLLAFSRKTVLEPKVLDLNEVVHETGKMLRRLIGEDVQLTTVLDPTIGRVKVDPDQLGQVLMNLAVNARDAMPRGGNLTVETRTVELEREYTRLRTEVTPGRYVQLSVSDSGTGMTEEVKAHIFEPFFTTKGVGKGTGLGLAVVLGIIKQSGGHVAVYSELGRGTTFKVYLPAVEERSAAAAGRSDLGELRGTETVLLAEDEDGVRGLAVLILQTHGYKVLVARDGRDAVRVVEKHQGAIDLLVTDVVMPNMGGRELADALRPRFPQMKVLFTSGYTDDAVVRHGILHEESAFIQKPYSPQALLRKVRQVLNPH